MDVAIEARRACVCIDCAWSAHGQVHSIDELRELSAAHAATRHHRVDLIEVTTFRLDEPAAVKLVVA